jgi:hypothetical protein
MNEPDLPRISGKMRCIFLILVCSIAWAADPPDAKTPPLQPEAQKVLAAYTKSVADAQQAYDKAETKARDEAIKALEKAKIGIAQKGDLDGANLVVAAIKKLTEIKPSSDLLGEKTEAPRRAETVEKPEKVGETNTPDEDRGLIGKWQGTNGTWEFKADGTGLCNSSLKVRWVLKEGSTYSISFDDPRRDRVIVITKPMKEAQEQMGGGTVVLNFVK